MSNKPASKPPQGSGNTTEGVLEIADRRQAWLRGLKNHLVPKRDDPTVRMEDIQRLGLRGGELVSAAVAEESRKGPPTKRVSKIITINGVPATDWIPPPPLAETTAIDPEEPLHLDTPGGPPSMRILQMFTPIGKGQRGLIVAPPRTGKTILLQQIAHGLAENHPEVYMIVMLIDERPEEVTDMRRNVRGEVIASSNDLDAESHVRVARLVIERARRLVEAGRDIVILLDSITRLARAFNTTIGSSGRTMTGGLDSRALIEPKQIFGSARNVEGGGSLTILGSALIETGSRADDFIFQEFKGTGNMELVLDRNVANMRIWPAVNLQISGTRKEEKLIREEDLRKINMLRRHLRDLPPAKQISTLVDKMAPHTDLKSFLGSLRG